MSAYGIIINQEEYDLLMLSIIDFQKLLKNKIDYFPYKNNHFVGFRLNKLLINPHIDFDILSCLTKKYLNRRSAMHDFK